MSISKEFFGTTADGQAVTMYTLTNKNGSYVKLLDYGAIIHSIVVKDRNNNPIDVALGYDSIGEYEKGANYFGAFIGRVANRIENACFELGGKKYPLAINDRGKNHLHGGDKGFDKYVYNVTEIENGLRFDRISPDMEEGYPGNLKVSVAYTFDDNNVLALCYEATADKDTPVNLTNHSYFNLNGHGNGRIENHIMQINADFFAQNTNECIPNGNIVTVEDTPFDFRTPKTIGRDINTQCVQLIEAGGYDHNYIPNGRGFRKMASAIGDISGIEMEVWSDMPGMQFYAGNFVDDQAGKNGAHYAARSGFALETQYYPNAIALGHFPDIILKAGDEYKSRTEYRFK